ncbi:MAG: spermidine/putrescine ABC transporter substrate-binding protein [Rhodobiaceae bacterium]|nr:spermidine-binding periplasmic protein SpuE [Rhodobiaceae bacterium]MCR9242670.1 spermidine/putrescine ABC transporter substrate-binding protein [Rhodobiaceae bacterium]
MKRNRGMAGLLQALSRRQMMQGAAAVGFTVSSMPTFANAAEEKKLSFYNWDTYIGETTLDDFKAATGIEVTMDLFADNDELFAKLREGNPGYDVIVPSNDYVARMAAAGMLEELDHSKIPNLSHLYPRFLGDDVAFDPGRKYSLPYMWGTIGIGYRKSKVTTPPDSWAVLYDSDEYAGKISIMSDCGTMIQMALRYLGHSINSQDDAELAAAEALITKQKQHIKAFHEDNGQDLLASGEVDIVMEWNGDIAQLMSEDDDIGYVVPKEGGLVWEDTLAIPKGAPHPENAHAFINYVYEPEVNTLIAEYIEYATPNKTAAESMDDSYSKNPAIFPPEDVLAKSESSLYLGEDHNAKLDEMCTRIFAA